jgi:hypothetical protein
MRGETMNKKAWIFTGFLSPMVMFTLCITRNPVMQNPDISRFYKTVRSPGLQDSLKSGKLMRGMPYFVAAQIFKDWTPGIKEVQIPVAGVGCKQRLQEKEGPGRVFTNPDTRIYLDRYKTSGGTLYIWYQKPDFYRMNVSAGDSLCVFLDDTVLCSPVACLMQSSVLHVKDALTQIPQDTNLYVEVHYSDNPGRTVSYWYTLQILGDGKTYRLKNLEFPIYPIERLELNGKDVSSFTWR